MSNFAHKTTRTNFKAEKKEFECTISYIPFGVKRGVEIIDHPRFKAYNEKDARAMLPSIIGRDWGEFTLIAIAAC